MGYKEYEKALRAQYTFTDEKALGQDSSNNGLDAKPMGDKELTIAEIAGRKGLHFTGGDHGSCYLELPENLLDGVNDQTGLTFTAWVNLQEGSGLWSRILDFGNGEGQPYLFLTRNMRGACFAGGELAVDPARSFPNGEWMHLALNVSGTKGGTESSAGMMLYINGELLVDGRISQTTSGQYGQLRKWFATLEETGNYKKNYLGRSQFPADDDLSAYLSDVRIYADTLEEDAIIELMCDSLDTEKLVAMTADKYLPELPKIAAEDLSFITSAMGNRVQITWSSNKPEVINGEGKITPVEKPEHVVLTAKVQAKNVVKEQDYDVTVLPKHLPAYTITVDGSKEVLDISETLWGLFYEDINNAADGGIYAEMIQNRSFEAFSFDTYDVRSGENGISTGRNHTPLFAWFGDTDKMTPMTEGGLREYFDIEDKDICTYYVKVADGAVIYNRGFCDSNEACAMKLIEGDRYELTFWAKADRPGKIKVTLLNEKLQEVSNRVEIEIDNSLEHSVEGGTWKKYGVEQKIWLTAKESLLGQLRIEVEGEVSLDMLSMFPEKVWGSEEEKVSKSAHTNYSANSNYRLRRDLVEALVELHPSFLRFPGGCISEGSYIWDNVYDWKDSVGSVETRKENFNVWGYNMTMGLGYMEYFQLAEDLHATPLPVMACGVLCQARSDYANPAGGALQEKYIKNFTDLIDFAISTDMKNNQWAALRKEMGHEAPFDLHYLGVGNENWGPEFMASFEIFYDRITSYMKENYEGYDFKIISTVGAQADDDAYRYGWKFLGGYMEGGDQVAFTDGEKSETKEVTWYQHQDHFMETIADEHYYRPNAYLLNNVDRYNYYYRAYDEKGQIDDSRSSKVFVGEYASTDKNSLAGAIAEAAVMTGFENNSDVVRLAATAPLFNKVLTDGTYRWTPDCIWFDDESVWHTPTYYVQQAFAKYIGTKLLGTRLSTYENGKPVERRPHGGIEMMTGNATICVKAVKVTQNQTGEVLFNQNFAEDMELDKDWKPVNAAVDYELDAEKGLVLHGVETGRNGFYLERPDWSDYTLEMEVLKESGKEGFYAGVGVTDLSEKKKNAIEYVIALNQETTGVKVYKDGLEGYTMGDFSSSVCAGNLRSSLYEPIMEQKWYTVTVNYGGTDGKSLICSYSDGESSSIVQNYKLEAYNKEVFTSVTKDDKQVYVKLVNPEEFAKVLRVEFADLSLEEEVKVITVTAEKDMAHVQNVNTKEKEVVVPVERTVSLKEGALQLEAAPYSLNVCVLTRK